MRRLYQFRSHLPGTYIPSPLVDPRGCGEAKMKKTISAPKAGSSAGRQTYRQLHWNVTGANGDVLREEGGGLPAASVMPEPSPRVSEVRLSRGEARTLHSGGSRAHRQGGGQGLGGVVITRQKTRWESRDQLGYV